MVRGFAFVDVVGQGVGFDGSSEGFGGLEREIERKWRRGEEKRRGKGRREERERARGGQGRSLVELEFRTLCGNRKIKERNSPPLKQ